MGPVPEVEITAAVARDERVTCSRLVARWAVNDVRIAQRARVTVT